MGEIWGRAGQAAGGGGQANEGGAAGPREYKAAGGEREDIRPRRRALPYSGAGRAGRRALPHVLRGRGRACARGALVLFVDGRKPLEQQVVL